MLSFRVLDADKGGRVEAHVRVTDADGTVVLDGLTKDERFDSNDHLHQYLLPGKTYSVEVSVGEKKWSERVTAETTPRLISWPLANANIAPAVGTSSPPDSPLVDGPSVPEPSKAVQSLEDYLKIEPERREPLDQQQFAKAPLSKEEAFAAEKLLWSDYRSTQLQARRAEVDSRVIQIGEMKMPFDVTVFGEKPEGGRSLYLSMHGGGGAPSRVNDRQWENQKKLYQLNEGVYVAPRAPTDTWDLWHQSHIDGFFDRLIEDMVLFEDVNPDRIYLLGYSAGGDGVYQVAPRMADRFAAASMMAGHPNETSPLGLRNLPFAIHMGEKDSAYNRNQTAQQWKEKLALLQSADPDGYVHFVKLHEGKGHWMDRQDAEALPWMSQFTRNRYPKKIVWKQDDVIEPRFYWLGVDREGLPDRALVVAEVDGQTIYLRDCDPDKLDLFLRDDWIDMSQEIKVVMGDTTLAQVQVPRTIATIDETIRQRGDPKGAFWGKLSINKPHARP
jgi:predicted esterase